MYLIEQLKQEIRDFLLTQGLNEGEIVLENPPEGVLADVAWPCYALAKKLKKNPIQIAGEVAERFNAKELVKEAVAQGPYVNFIAKRIEFNQGVFQQIVQASNCYGSLEVKHEKIGLEYLSPNSNKALMIGHTRNATIGMSLVQILRFAGYEVVPIILYNDRGIHICKSMLAYQRWGENKTPDEMNMKPDHMIGYFYVMFGQKSEKDEKLLDEAGEMLKKWEDGDEEVRALWSKMNGWFFEGVEQTLKRVGVEFEKKYFESDFYHLGKEIVEEALEKGQAYKLDDGAVEVDLTDVNLDKKILLRKDGTTVYMVQDLYLAKKKIDDLALDRSIYVVGSEQIYHFNVLFELLDRFDIADKSKTYHLAYAMVNAASGKKMSSRKGEGEKWDDLLDELKDLAAKEILIRDKDLDKKIVYTRAEIVAQAALKFVMLNQDVNKTITFDKNEVIRFDGETGSYLLYTYARVNSILEKAKISEVLITETDNLELNEIVLQCARLPELVDRSAREYNPAVMAHFIYDLSQKVNNFYHKHRVLDNENIEQKNSRLAMLLIVKQVMQNCFAMLGMKYLEKM